MQPPAKITRQTLSRSARQLARLLDSRQQLIVFAESCTGGMVSATLTEVPGVSARHCGSAVVYQVETKIAWLGVDAQKLKKPGPVSRVVAEQMATGVLEKTPAATISAAITGHLGPNAPAKQDGLVYVAVAVRDADGSPRQAKLVRQVLDIGTGSDSSSPRSLRHQRQLAAAWLVLETACQVLQQLPAAE